MEKPGEPKTKISIGDGLMAAHVLLAVVGAIYVFSMTFSVAGCAERCDYQTLEFTTRGFWSLDLVVLLLGAASYFLLRSRVRWAWAIPGVGIVFTVVASALAVLAINGALVLG